MIEEWKYVKGYTGLYSVSNYGNVQSHITGKILKPAINHKGYLIVQLCLNGHRKNKRIHRLVAEAFLPNTEGFPEVDHIDNDVKNNRVDNLRWATGSYNTRNREVCRRATSKYNGVQKTKTGTYKASAWFERKTVYLGTFKEEVKAAQAFNKFCSENRLNRELNLIEEVFDGCN